MECFPVLLRAYVIALAIFALSNTAYIQAAEGKILSLFVSLAYILQSWKRHPNQLIIFSEG